jgi:DNA ligase-1
MQELPKLYKRDNTGSIRVWWIQTDGSRYRSCSGKSGGAITSTDWTVCEAKNVGKSNAITPELQVRNETDSLYTKKKKRGYTEDQAGIDEAKEKMIGVMLAHDYNDHKHKLIFPVWSQPKLDGIRCISKADGLWSRKGEHISTVPHIEEIVVEICEKHQIVFDGELYNHILRDDFNEISSLVRRQKADAKHAAKVRDVVQYHIYDLVDPGMSFIERQNKLQNIQELHDWEEIVIVPTLMARTASQLDEDYELALENGYEGQMVRQDKPYEYKRTASLLKRKEFQDEEFEIIAMVEGKGNRSGMVGAIVFETPEGERFQAALMGTNDFRRRIWLEHQRNPFTGVEATVKYFRKTPGGIPRFPVVKSIDENK